MSDIKWVSTTSENPWKEKAYQPSGAAQCSNLKTTGETDQVIDGFGGCFNELGQIALERLPEKDHEKILDLLFSPDADGTRFNYCRTPMGASDYGEHWYSYNETENDYAMEHFSIDGDRKYLLPYIQAALKRYPSMTLFASPWSPPTWMKFPKAYNFGTLNWTKENLQAYALYFAKYVQAYAAEGIRVDQVHIQNEFFSDQKFPSCKWTGEQMIEFIRDYIGPLFKKLGLDTKIFLGTFNNGTVAAFHEYLNSMEHDPKAAAYVQGVSFQWAGKNCVPLMKESFPEVYTIQSENECGDGWNSWGTALYTYSLLRHYLTHGVRAYTYWNMVLDEGGMSTWGWRQNSMITVKPDGTYVLNPEFYIMKHFSRFVKPGAVRLVLAGHWTSTSVAFRNADGSVVLVTQNPFQHSQTVEFQHEGRSYALDLPADSVNTFIF